MIGQPKRFQKTVEDFVCEHCGHPVAGNGYTNHCSQCLWSKHVDVNPGDRLATCNGLMEPISVEHKNDDYILTQRCTVCGHEKRNKMAKNDNFDAAIAISKKSDIKR